MITYNWNKDKNILLKKTRGISFEQVVMHIENGDLIDIIKHPNSQKYANQKILVININNYICFIIQRQRDRCRLVKRIGIVMQNRERLRHP